VGRADIEPAASSRRWVRCLPEASVRKRRAECTTGTDAGPRLRTMQTTFMLTKPRWLRLKNDGLITRNCNPDVVGFDHGEVSSTGRGQNSTPAAMKTKILAIRRAYRGFMLRR